MLGKGLESLIPPNQGKKPDSTQPVQAQTAGAQPEPRRPVDVRPVQPAPLTSEPKEEVFIKDAVNVGPTPSIHVEPLEDHLLEGGLEPEKELPAGQEEIVLPTPRTERATRPAVAEVESGRLRPSKEHAVFYLETNKIRPNEHQPRKHFDETAIKELAASIREYGILQPIVVAKREKEVPTGTEVEYELIAGERRLMAAKSLGMERIPAIIRHVDIERERLELAIIENLQREDLNGVEMARAFARLQDEFRLTQREIAVRLGKSRESVANTLRLLDLPTDIQEAIEKGEITDSHGLFLLGINDPAIQQALFRDLLDKKMTIRELRHKAQVLQKKVPREGASDSPEIKFLEERLASGLGAPVSIHQKGDSGKITIDFYSKEELDELIRRLGVQED